MLPPIVEEAIAIINAAPAHGPLRHSEYAQALPPRAAALARLLSNPDIRVVAEEYRQADGLAVKAQNRFKRLAWTAAYTGLLAALLGGLLLYLGTEASTEALRSNLGLAQFVFLIVSMLCAFLLFVFKPYREWGRRRGSAEATRLRLFALVMSSTSDERQGEIPLLPLQLECFRRHLLDDQRGYFAKRGPQHRWTVRVWQVIGVVAVFFVLAASLPQFARLEPWELIPDRFRDFIIGVSRYQEAYALVGLIGGSVQGLLAALTVISPAQRNAEKFKQMLELLNTYADADLATARVAAAKGDGTTVSNFALRVSNDLAEESREWLLLQKALSEMTLQQLAKK